MGFVTFIKNIKYLFKYNLKQINNKLININEDVFYSNVSKMIDNLEYELPNNPYDIKKPKIYNFEDTLSILATTKKSFIRFGDGEIRLILNEDIGFQSPNNLLSKRLKQILLNSDDNILVGINYHYYYADLRLFHEYPRIVYRTFVNRIRDEQTKLLDLSKNYCSAGVTCAYTTFKEWCFEDWYNKWKQLWDNKKICIICGDRVFSKIEYNIFDNAKHIEYIYESSQNAFEHYDSLLEKAKQIDKDRIILLILGPTAKVLAYIKQICLQQKKLLVNFLVQTSKLY